MTRFQSTLLSWLKAYRMNDRVGKLLTLDLKQSSRVRLLTVWSRSKFVYTKLVETGVKKIVYAGRADGCDFIPVILKDTAEGSTVPHRRLQDLPRRQSTLRRDDSTARPLARGAGSQMNWGQGPRS